MQRGFNCSTFMAHMLECAIAAGAVQDPMVPALYAIEGIKRETRDTFTLDLKPKNGSHGEPFEPGQFNMLYVFGVGEVPISISSDCATFPALQHTTRIAGAVTKAMSLLKRGDTIGVRGPFGSQWPVAEKAGRDFVIIAGGIGLAPLRPVLYALTKDRAKYQKIVLLYGTRTPEDILYRPELERWRSKLDLDIQIAVDRGSSRWRGNVGVVTTLIGRSAFEPANTVALVCGPEVMMRFALMELQKRGVPAEQTFLSMERNMKCAVGFCGHCQYGPTFICKDGPVFRFDRIAPIFGKAEI
jgi:NAD(P)H-flavin reductase